MHRYLKSRPRWLQAGWLLPLVLLALPNCILESGPYDPGPPAFEPGPAPHTSAVMCDIPKYKIFDANEDCASAEDELKLPSLAHAAIGLAEGDIGSIALDYSSSSMMQCGNRPKKITFHGSFPSGSPICLNCETQFQEKYADANAVCVAKCIDLTDASGPVPPEGAQAYCQANARVATNFTETCYKGACFGAAAYNEYYDDPRRYQEPVVWEKDPDGFAEIDGNSISKPDEPEPVDGKFDSGAASQQIITRGDAWIEFEARETGVSHVVGVASADVPVEGLKVESIAFALSLNYDEGNVYVLVNGANGNPIEKYVAERRYRVVITDKHDGTATVSYVRLDQDDCKVGVQCPGAEIATSNTPIAYPLRVFATLRETNSQISNVTMVYIKDQQ